jgi:hypothetical protein
MKWLFHILYVQSREHEDITKRAETLKLFLMKYHHATRPKNKLYLTWGRKKHSTLKKAR